MHQALYRKWRPKSFDEVCGQEHITSILKYEVANTKFSHAYLFCGSRGTGKTTCAKILAKAVNCLTPENGNPCGKCEACLSIEEGSNTDVLEMDAASNNGVDNIRDIRDEVVYSPSVLKYRVYIIDEVHMLSTSAFNALLKTLEEPPAHVVFILATTELHKLPATIISRCQRFDFRRIATDVLKSRLLYIAEHEGIELEESAAIMLSKQAQGGMRDAISLLELCAGSRERITPDVVNKTVGSSGRDEMLRVVKAISDKDYETIFASVEEVVRSSGELTVFWQDLISVYRDLLIMKTAQNPGSYLDLTDSELTLMKPLAAKFSTETLSYHCGLLEDALLSMLKANSVKRIVAELTLVRMCDTRLSMTPEAMLSRIAVLEERLAQGKFTVTTENNTDMAVQEKSETTFEKPTKEKRNPPTFSDDDEEFRSDAPTSSAKKESKATAVSGNVRTLRPYKNRAEVMDRLTTLDPMIAPFFKGAKWYTDGEGRTVLKFDASYSIDSIKTFKGDGTFLKALSSVSGEQISADRVLYEADEKKNTGSVIDEIIEAAND